MVAVVAVVVVDVVLDKSSTAPALPPAPEAAEMEREVSAGEASTSGAIMVTGAAAFFCAISMAAMLSSKLSTPEEEVVEAIVCLGVRVWFGV